MRNSNKRIEKLFIGTSGWSYPHWAKGVFYPKSVSTREWLPYYANVFQTVEVNSTFYRLPNPILLDRWIHITPKTFRFAVKIWRRISHDLRLREIQKELSEFYNSVKPLHEKTSVYLLQMPPSFVPELENLKTFFILWKDIFPTTKLAIELRNKKAFVNEVFHLLREYNVALCLEDYRGCEIEDVLTADWVYVRRHGPSGRYRGEYSIDQLYSDAKKIHGWLTKGYEVYVYFNNDFGGYAPKNALQLTEIIKNMQA